ncbi:MAG: hypothetical protein KIT69_04205 [Propionibacteriaceae bacterium]|nr:hypothetical protein [Propionibacteriaceae bacterium]
MVPAAGPTIESVLVGVGEEGQEGASGRRGGRGSERREASLLPEAAQLEHLETQGFVRLIRVRDVDEWWSTRQSWPTTTGR